MDHTTPKYCESPPVFASQGESAQEKTKGNPFEEDPICNLNLKETSEFVKSLPMGYGLSQAVQKRREKENVVVWNSMARKMESPSTPGRQVFSFGNVARQCVSSKWDDAEKWLFSGGSCHASPAHPAFHNEAPKASNSKGLMREDGSMAPSDVPLKDKFTDGLELFHSNSKLSKPKNDEAPMKDGNTEVVVQKLEAVTLVKHREIGTEMTPIGSTTTSRCHSPFISTSPARHNTPATQSGVLAKTTPTDLTKQLQEYHLAKLQVGSAQFDSKPVQWTSREEEEEELSKSLRHFVIGRRSVSVSGPRPCAWELEEEKNKSCVGYQREEARIQAWMNLQTAKAEAQSRKLEVKIQKMRSELEQKLIKRMSIVHRKAEEWRAAAQVEHGDQIGRASQRTHKEKHIINFKHHTHNRNSNLPHLSSCACFRRTAN